MDIDALLARAPEVAVVDELAHTNVPGSRNEKRWQDIEELLDAGIDVLSTVNVQHLESLNDVVQRITGVQQRETVPDEVVRRAEQIELVDITPEALRRRLAHGNVYAAHRIDAALGNYFRLGNLTALRELALLWVADQVDVALQRYRAEQEITDTWETRERVVAAITGGPESETLIRRARRIAPRAGAELLVVHVLRGDGLTGVHPGRGRQVPQDRRGPRRHLPLRRRRRRADRAAGVRPRRQRHPARARHVPPLPAGAGVRRGHRRRRSCRSPARSTCTWSRTTSPGAGCAWKIGRSALSLSRRLVGWALAVVLPALVTGLGLLWRDDLAYSTDLVGFLLATVRRRAGRRSRTGVVRRVLRRRAAELLLHRARTTASP